MTLSQFIKGLFVANHYCFIVFDIVSFIYSIKAEKHVQRLKEAEILERKRKMEKNFSTRSSIRTLYDNESGKSSDGISSSDKDKSKKYSRSSQSGENKS